MGHLIIIHYPIIYTYKEYQLKKYYLIPTFYNFSEKFYSYFFVKICGYMFNNTFNFTYTPRF